MDTQQIIEKIIEFESEFGESFVDRFMHDNVADPVWAGFLLGMGYHERANYIFNKIVTDKYGADQEALYNVNSTFHYDPKDGSGLDYFLNYTEDENNPITQKEQNKLYDKDIHLWAIFLNASAIHYTRFVEFLTDSGVEIND